jgi:hypothetical protein
MVTTPARDRHHYLMKEVDRGKSVREPIEIVCSKKTCSLRPTALAARPMTHVYSSSILPLASSG